MKIDFGFSPPSCQHSPMCYLWRTKDERYIPVCELEDSHLQNIVTSHVLHFAPFEAVNAIGNEWRKRQEEKNLALIQNIETTQDLVYSFKSLSIEDDSYGASYSGINPSSTLGIHLSSRVPWKEKTLRADCGHNSRYRVSEFEDSLVEHLINPDAMHQAHGTLTGCGIYSFQDRSAAAAYTTVNYGAKAVAMLQLFGVVNDVEFELPNEYGFVSEYAKIVRLWIPESSIKYCHPDALIVLPIKYDIPVSVISSSEFSKDIQP